MKVRCAQRREKRRGLRGTERREMGLRGTERREMGLRGTERREIGLRGGSIDLRRPKMAITVEAG